MVNQVKQTKQAQVVNILMAALLPVVKAIRGSKAKIIQSTFLVAIFMNFVVDPFVVLIFESFFPVPRYHFLSIFHETRGAQVFKAIGF